MNMQSQNNNRVLIIDDDVSICDLLKSFLSGKGFIVNVAYTGNAGIELCRQQSFDFIICDYRLGDKNGFEVFNVIKEIQPAAKVIIITAYSEIKMAVKAIKMGAVDFISKPLVPEELLALLGDITYEKVVVKPVHYSQSATHVPGFWESTSPVMKELYDEMELIAPTDYSVIIYGESGTGKEMLARAIHLKSKRKNEPFIALDCGTLSKELAGSELFGHIKGSFTGAHLDKTGQLELANKGTLFLDEVGNLPLDVQASLLRVVQERKFRKIGDNKEQHTDLRILVASNENLQKAYQRGIFREDLYHRFNEFKMNLPPLRERKEDIMLFADYFLQEVNSELRKDVKGFDEEVHHIFMHYEWPGNLRELKNAIRRAALLVKGEIISRDVIPYELMRGKIEHIQKPQPNDGASNQNLKTVVAKTEKEMIINILHVAKNNKTKAAAMLKIDRKTLYNKLKEFGIIPAKFN